VGGPSETESYECRAGCPCAFGGGVWSGRVDRGVVRAAVDPGPSGDRRLGAVVARSGGGDLRGRADRVRAGPVPDHEWDRLRGRGALEAATPVGRAGQDRRARCPAPGPAAAPGRDRRGHRAERGAGGGAGSGPGAGGCARGSDVGAAPVVEAAATPRPGLLRRQGLDRVARPVAGCGAADRVRPAGAAVGVRHRLRHGAGHDGAAGPARHRDRRDVSSTGFRGGWVVTRRRPAGWSGGCGGVPRTPRVGRARARRADAGGCTSRCTRPRRSRGRRCSATALCSARVRP
jgi:hypothetical protein